ncbi:MAG: hypothetical protein JKY37_31300 [Nannocystaceae bacterium]|nr:hypothetical protein [Nannocystaceae bacterium]
MTIAEQLRAEGRVEGLAEGLAEGTAKTKAASVLLVLGTRGLQVNKTDLRRIEACVDVERLDHWLQLAVTVNAVEDIFEG